MRLICESSRLLSYPYPNSFPPLWTLLSSGREGLTIYQTNNNDRPLNRQTHPHNRNLALVPDLPPRPHHRPTRHIHPTHFPGRKQKPLFHPKHTKIILHARNASFFLTYPVARFQSHPNKPNPTPKFRLPNPYFLARHRLPPLKHNLLPRIHRKPQRSYHPPLPIQTKIPVLKSQHQGRKEGLQEEGFRPLPKRPPDR